jgi:hypothetical protein
MRFAYCIHYKYPLPAAKHNYTDSTLLKGVDIYDEAETTSLPATEGDITTVTPTPTGVETTTASVLPDTTTSASTSEAAITTYMASTEAETTNFTGELEVAIS